MLNIFGPICAFGLWANYAGHPSGALLRNLANKPALKIRIGGEGGAKREGS